MFHIVHEDGAWSLWYDGRIIGRYATREESENAEREWGDDEDLSYLEPGQRRMLRGY